MYTYTESGPVVINPPRMRPVLPDGIESEEDMIRKYEATRKALGEVMARNQELEVICVCVLYVCMYVCMYVYEARKALGEVMARNQKLEVMYNV